MTISEGRQRNGDWPRETASREGDINNRLRDNGATTMGLARRDNSVLIARASKAIVICGHRWRVDAFNK